MAFVNFAAFSILREKNGGKIRNIFILTTKFESSYICGVFKIVANFGV